MTIKVAFISNKGGVAKTSLSRLLASYYGKLGKRVKICVFDTVQNTSNDWEICRRAALIKPNIDIQRIDRVCQHLDSPSCYDIIIFDGQPYSNNLNVEIGSASDAVFVPSGLATDDLAPTVRLVHNLNMASIPFVRTSIVLTRILNSKKEVDFARGYIEQTGYRILHNAYLEKTGYRQAHNRGLASDDASNPILRTLASNLALVKRRRKIGQYRRPKVGHLTPTLSCIFGDSGGAPLPFRSIPW